jgi:hypothetical protein
MTQASGERCLRFPTTHWSLIADAGGVSPDAKRRALSEMLKQYMPALRSHLTYNRKLNQHDASDLLQSFIADKLLTQDLLRHANRARGRFRNFLLVTLNRFASNYFRHERAAKRSPGHRVCLDDAIPSRDRPCGEAFDVSWARQVLSLTIDRMRDECRASARPDVWGVFEARILGPTLYQREPIAYQALVQQLGFKSPTQATNTLITANRMFQRNLRAVVGAYVKEPCEIDDEIRELREILSNSSAEFVSIPGNKG